MEQTNNNYPRFERGQVLTSEALNNYFGYLDEQQRLTRAKLLGVGIINGLGVNYVGSKLLIRKGTAVTADGYLIELPEDTTYTLMHKYDKKSTALAKQNPLIETVDKDFETVLGKVKYVFYKDKSDAAEHNVSSTSPYYFNNDWLEDYDIALMVDFASQDTITKCNELSCDIVQNNYQIEIRPVLIDRSCVGKDYFTDLITTDVEISLDKLNKDVVLNPKKPHEFFRNTFEQLQASITSEIDQVKTIINSFGNNLFENVSESDVTAVTDRIEKMHNIVVQQYEKKTLRFSGYYLDFLFQLRIAIREFLTTYFDFVCKHKTIPNNTKAFPRIVVIGFGKLRRQTIVSDDSSSVNDLTILRKHLSRIFSMSKYFYIYSEDCIKSNSNNSLSFKYYKKESKLEERDIPGFINSEKCNNWHANSITESSLSTDKKLLDIYEQIPILSEYEMITDNYYGRSIKEYTYGLTETVLSKNSVDISLLFKHRHEILVDASQPDFFKEFTFDKTRYKNEVLDEYNKNPILKEINNYKDTIDKIVKGKALEIKETDLTAMIKGITSYFQSGGYNIYLEYTKEFLSRFCDIHGIITIGGCQTGGELYVFYSGDNEKLEDTFISLIIGT